MPSAKELIRSWLGRSKKRWPIIIRRASFINRHVGATFLILTTGPTLRTHRPQIEAFLRQHPECVTIACNFIGDLCIPRYHLIINRKRFCMFGPQVHPASTILVGDRIGRWVIRAMIGDRGFEVVPYAGEYAHTRGSLRISPKGRIFLDGGTLVTTAIAVALIMGATNIYCAGMDGFSLYRDRQDDIHFFKDPDQIQFDRRERHERCTWDILQTVDSILSQRGGRLRVITPTVYTNWYDAECCQ